MIKSKRSSQGVYTPHLSPYSGDWKISESLVPIKNQSTKTTEYSNKHEFVSLAFASNVPGFEKAKCVIRNETQTSYDFIHSCLSEMM